MTATSAAAIAAKVLSRAHESGVPVSNMKLQKLVTLVQSLSVYATGHEAFREDVQAWKNGPAIKPLYGSYKRFGSDAISEVVPSRHSQDPVPPAIEQPEAARSATAGSTATWWDRLVAAPTSWKGR